ncbi:U4/U6.U5 tri-snRNP-associated protein 1-like [Centruroides sculpturatus]|uniref:U4/U6.U5 tri-snRNP-associated protein 1-like n=1 Tax=Centruroides sculpturatus TaxID=218467 RepID=UPI000C6DE989|nr:U4/U6.U5 tri-snRNP-associated protein 1-like [Centruroides sculpturatus]
MDKEFGVGALIEEEFNMKKKAEKNYGSKDLKGLVVGHSQEKFEEGQNIILTLKDKGVLEESEDVLENVNFIDNEKAAKNIENKLRKSDYKPYDDEFDEFGMVKKKTLLSKYDEEIDGVKKETFVIGASVVDREKQLELIRMKLKQQQEVTLDLPALKIANEYYTTEEMVRFKKPKKKVRKVRKRELLKPEDLIPLPGENAGIDHGSRKTTKNVAVKQSNKVNEKEEEYLYNSLTEAVDMEIDKNDLEEPEIMGPEEDLTGVPVEEDKAELELQMALTKARKLKQKEILSSRSEKVAEAIKNSEINSTGASLSQNKIGSIVLNSTAEFCRTLGEIPTYGMSGNRDEEAEELMDYEKELVEEKKRLEQEAQNRGAWNEVDIEEKPVEIKNRENEPILEEEPDVSCGLAGALALAMKKGYLEQESKKLSSAPRPSQLQAQTYTIEEKFYEDDKFGKRDRYTGPIQDFKEKDTYKPDVKLEYIDDSGRILTAKEAFRYLSHKFHGKGPGKNKVDKRMKKLDQDARLKQMSSTDTPLNTLKMLQEKQKELQTPYIVLSGGNKTLTQTSLAKPK